MKSQSEFPPDPYQILFPIGILHALLGAGVWITFSYGGTLYPGLSHAHHMVSGFLLSFAAGFMMTAIPRFMGSRSPHPSELAFASALAAVSLIFPGSLPAMGLLIFLLVFFISRLRSRTFTPPPHFIFIPIGITLGITGAGLLSLIDLGLLQATFIPAGRLFLFHGPMLAFILGIGSKLVSALLGWSDGPVVQIAKLSTPVPPSFFGTIARHLPTFLALLFLASFLLEATGYIITGRIVRAGCASWIAFRHWHIHRRPKLQGKLVRWLWLSTWMLMVGLWVSAILPSVGIHAAHLYLIGAFGLMTLMIASRVTLAHGGYEIRIEANSRVFTVTGGLILLAALTRFTAPWTQNPIHHYAYAAITWILGLMAWAIFFVPRMVRKSKT